MTDPEQPPNPEETWPEGTRLGSYRVERPLGRGGMGEIFLACDERLGRRVAIKRVRRGAATAGADRERFRREARAVARLNHPAVVQVYDLVEEASGDALVLEYVEGRTLRELLADGLPDLRLALRLARQIAEGLAAAHAAGLVHRDLKAENVIVTPDGRAKILDFGLAKLFTAGEDEESLTTQGALLGTYRAMSPEQAGGEAVDARSDLFSFGVLLYEMLAGRSPFLGGTPAETLQRVQHHQPPPLAAVRPDLPPDLSALVERLLAKDRLARPRSAREVASTLGTIARTAALADGDGEEASSELPTVVPKAAAGGGRMSSSALRPVRAGTGRAILAAAVLAAVALGAAELLRRRPVEPLRVLVLPPTVTPAGDERLDLAASGLLVAALSSLASCEGLAPLDPAQTGGTTGSPAELARAAAADEVLAVSLQRQGELTGRASLRRIHRSDGQVLWAESFTVPTEPGDLRLLVDAVAVHLRRAYRDHRVREGVPELAVRDQDWAELLQVKHDLDRGGSPAGAEDALARLESILRGSPRFLEAHLVIAYVAQNLFRSTRDPGYLERGRAAAGAARALAPGDPRPLMAQIRIALAAARPEEARALLAELTPLMPGDPELLALSGQVAESAGDLPGAIADLEAAARQAPSWYNLYRLADLEAKAGRIPGARRHLQELLARSPGNPWGLDRLGNLELLAGDPARAEQIYLGLIRQQPHRAYYTNLGLARLLRGRTAEAVAAYREALKLSPGHVAVLLNLADGELALGRAAEARELYRQTLARLAEIETAAGGLSPTDRMIRAQCLAHLGRTREAVEVVQETLRQSSGDPQVVYAASLVYAVAGDRTSALVNAKTALEHGVEPRWFTLAAFGPLRNDPELQALLRRESTPAAER